MSVHPSRPVAAKPASRAMRLALSLAVAAFAALALLPAIANAYVYWGSQTDTIGRANLDGTDADQSFVSGADDAASTSRSTPATSTGRTTSTGTIGRADLDGSNVDQSFITDAGYPIGVAVDAGHVYWANNGTDTIGRADLDGTERRPGASSPAPAARRRRGRRRPRLLGERAGHDRPRRPRRLEPRPELHHRRQRPDRRRGRRRPRLLGERQTSAARIGRADLDGPNPDQSFIPALPSRPASRSTPATSTGPTTTRPRSAAPTSTARTQTRASSAARPVRRRGRRAEPPDTTIESTKVNRDKRKASFTFSSSQPDSSFRCKLDDKDHKGCESPKVYKDLDRGKHTFKVKARNAQKADDPSPATVSFKI